ncbi:MAG: prepilin-type N-terminal cleavage/methylation domain-containing protein, partial [Salinibacterium sp.]|nr:prepilin-type N-terminal cleavage/methylation domain-containing protein [Salinibacterium sp.]
MKVTGDRSAQAGLERRWPVRAARVKRSDSFEGQADSERRGDAELSAKERTKMNASMTRKQRTACGRGFTLIELLVVIAIIALL